MRAADTSAAAHALFLALRSLRRARLILLTMEKHDVGFAGRPVTVLGLGFLGFYISARLNELGAVVTVLTRRRLSEVVNRLPPGIKVIEGDIRHGDDVRRAIEGPPRCSTFAGCLALHVAMLTRQAISASIAAKCSPSSTPLDNASRTRASCSPDHGYSSDRR